MPGESVRTLVDDLALRGVVQHPDTAIFLLELSGLSKRLRAGQYVFEPSMTFQAWLTSLKQHHQKYYPVTLLDGWTYEELTQHLALNPYLHHDLPFQQPNALMHRISGCATSPEGAFLPNTYFVRLYASETGLLKRAYKAMQVEFGRAWAHRAIALPLHSKHQALVLASLVELEAQKTVEMPVIASVFYNRLKKGMRLQSDPTVLYAVHKPYGSHISRHDLRFNSAFNTYTHAGLPADAIALPSKNAIVAVLHPAHTGYYYFEAKGRGRHRFSSNLTEQRLAIQERDKE